MARLGRRLVLAMALGASCSAALGQALNLVNPSVSGGTFSGGDVSGQHVSPTGASQADTLADEPVARAASLAALAARSTATLTDGSVIQLLGYASAGDMGAGLWRFSASSLAATDGGTVVQPADRAAAGRWLRSFTGCIQVGWFGAKGDGSTVATTAVQAAYNAAGSANKCVEFDTGSYVLGQINFNAYNNVTTYCKASSNGAAGGTKFIAASLTATVINVTSVSGVFFHNCTWVSASQQTAGSYLKFTGVNSAGCYNCFFNRGYDPVYFSDSSAIAMDHTAIRNTAHIAATHTGTTLLTSTHDVYWTTPIFDQDDESNPNIQAGIYVDYSGGSIQIFGGDILHQHNNLWLNPGLGQAVIWLYASLTDFDSADFPDNLRGGVSFKVTPHGGGIANGNICNGCWASTGTLAGVQLVGDATSTCHCNQLVQLQSLHNYQTAVLTDYCDKTVLDVPLIAGASISTPGAYSAVEVGGHTLGFSLTGGSIGAGDGYAATQKFNLQVDAGMTGHLVVNSVDMSAPTGSGLVAPVYVDPTALPAVGSGITNSPGFNFIGPVTSASSASPWAYQASAAPEVLNVTATGTLSVVVGGVTVCSASPCSTPLAPFRTATITYGGSASLVRTVM